MSSFCKSPGKHCRSELLIAMPFFPALSSLVLFILKLYPQNSRRKKSCTRPQNPHKQCTCKSTANAKKAASAEETTHNQQEMWCQHPTNVSRPTDLFFSSVGNQLSYRFTFNTFHPYMLNSWFPFSDICRNAQCRSFERTAKVIGLRAVAC